MLVADLTAALATWTGRRRGPAGRPRAAALSASLVAGDLDGGFGAFGGLVKRDLQVVSQARTPLCAAPATAAAEQIAESEEVAQTAQDVPEVGEDGRVEPTADTGAKPE